MEDYRRALQDRGDCREVADVHNMEIDAVPHLGEVRFLAGAQVIDDRDAFRAAGQKASDDGAANETGAACDNWMVHSVAMIELR